MYFDWAYAGKVTVALILILLFCAWISNRLIALSGTWDRLAEEAERDRIVGEDQTKVLARVAHSLDEMDAETREQWVG